MNAKELWVKMMNGMAISYEKMKMGTASEYWQATAVLLCDNKSIPAGTKVRVVMASRFGDLGVTKDLKAESGYDLRVEATDENLKIEEVFLI